MNNEMGAPLHDTLKKICRNTTNLNEDTFVGIKSNYNGNELEITVNFPLGYKISETDAEIRDDVFTLIDVLQRYKGQSQLMDINNLNDDKLDMFPITSYLFVILYYLNNGYYMEKEEVYEKGLAGPINWNRTIKQEFPYIQKNGFVYPIYQVRKNNDTEKSIITDINKIFVYESYQKIGWIYKIPEPQRVEKKINKSTIERVLLKEMNRTNIDKHKQLFKSMLDILYYLNENLDQKNYEFGTYNFQYLWEFLIEETYGNKDKKYFFPRTTWHLNTSSIKKNHSLEPDTIMENEQNYYILDAKYYKYGTTLYQRHLPESSSINKQITYGEYLARNPKFKDIIQTDSNIYNSFLMPFNKKKHYFNTNSNYYSIGEARSEWKKSEKNYEKVQGILVDVKHLMKNKVNPSQIEIKSLAEAIQLSIKNNNSLLIN